MIKSVRNIFIAIAAGAVGLIQAATFTVSKDGRGAFTTIQAAVNKAGPGDVVEILDASVYNEQVTIDSTKNGLTLRSANPTALQKPTIRWQDVIHVNPTTCGSGPTGSLNPTTIDFDQNGALRLIRVHNVTIDGIGINGVAPAPYGYNAVWGPDGFTCNGQLAALFAGNGGIAVYVSGAITIQNCDIDSAYYGISVKDRNIGGIFANPNPADLAKQYIVPLSGFGQCGGHVFENNRIHNNSQAIFFESSWDLGSTIRYNLFYENHHPSAPATATEAYVNKLPDGPNEPGGGIMFKDVMLSPVAIYNNTFYHNSNDFTGHYRPGAQHLVFNNIYATPSPYNSNDAVYPNSFLILDPYFVNRMHNCLYAAQTQPPALDSQQVQAQQYDTATKLQVTADSVVKFYRNVRIMNNMDNPVQSSITVNLILPMSSGPVVVPQTLNGAIVPGALISDGAATQAFPTSAGVRWFEIPFQSTDPASPLFLTPNWNDTLIQRLVMNAGWPAAGIYNSDGKVADIGAISSAPRSADNILINPLSPAIFNAAKDSATLSFNMAAFAGGMQNPSIKYIMLVDSLPVNLNGFGGAATLIVPPPESVTPTSTSLNMGGNTVKVSGFPAMNHTYAFFELIAQGTGSNGNPITSNVGFIPYRQLSDQFIVTVLNAVTGLPITTVTAGDTVGLRIVPEYATGAAFPNTVSPVSVALNSGANLLAPGNPPGKFSLAAVPSAGITSKVIFTKVPAGGVEYVSASGIYAGTDTLAFYGISSGIKILPAAASVVQFEDPPSKILTPGSAPVIDPDVTYPVTVQVTDKYGNVITAPNKVSVISSEPLIGTIVGVDTATNDSVGIATFNAKVTNGKMNDIFTLGATLVGTTATDSADLKVGQQRNKLWILYSDTAAYNDTVSLRGQVGQRFPVTIRASVDGTAPIDSFATVMTITLSPGLAAYASLTSTTPITQATLVKGQIVIYVTGVSAVTDGSITATPPDNSILAGTRADIYFTVPPVKVASAAYFADNGFGRVNRMELYLTDSLLWVPDSMTLQWPSAATPGMHVTAAQITVDPANNKHITVSLATPFPPNLTTYVGTNNLGVMYTRNPAGDSLPSLVTGFAIADSVGPLLDTAAVQIQYDTGNAVLEISFTEKVNPSGLTGSSLLLIVPGNATPIPLTVLTATALDTTGLGFKVTVQSSGVAPAPGDSLKINAAGSIADLFTNKANPLNRPVVLDLKIVPPPALAVLSAAYFADNGFGQVDRAEIHMVKDLAAVPDSVLLTWPDSAFAKMVKTGITWDPGDKKHVTVVLANPFPPGITAPTATTSPGMLYTHVPVVGAPAQVTPLALADSVGPLLDSAMVLEKFGPGSDTLFLSVSENIFPNSLTGSSLVLIRQVTRDSIPLLILGMDTTTVGGFTYEVAVQDLGAQAPVAGDSLKINPAGPLSDIYGNMANPLNRPVVLRLRLVPRPPNLSVTVDQPIVTVLPIDRPDFVVLGNLGGTEWQPIQGSQGGTALDCAEMNCGPVVTADNSGHTNLPAITLEIDRPVHYKINLFTNLGEVVNGFSGDVTAAQLGLDENGVPLSGAGVFARGDKGIYDVKIIWNGRSSNGQLAGTGVYIARTSLSGTSTDTNSVTRSVGDVKTIRFGIVRP